MGYIFHMLSLILILTFVSTNNGKEILKNDLGSYQSRELVKRASNSTVATSSTAAPSTVVIQVTQPTTVAPQYWNYYSTLATYLSGIASSVSTSISDAGTYLYNLLPNNPFPPIINYFASIWNSITSWIYAFFNGFKPDDSLIVPRNYVIDGNNISYPA